MANDEFREDQESRRQFGKAKQHEKRLENALIEQLARAIDPEIFDETKKRSSHPAAVIQIEARKFMAREAAKKIARPIAEAVDLCWKATPYGETEDGDVHTYIVPKGVVHRLVGALQGIGVSAALRSFSAPDSPAREIGSRDPA